MVSCFAKVQIFRFWLKTMDYVMTENEVIVCGLYSLLEGATKLNFAPFCSP